jgi:hypothetical protein
MSLTSPRTLRGALALLLAASLPQCASAPVAPPVVAPPPPAPTPPGDDVADVAPAALPDDAVLLVRVGSVRGSVRRLGAMLGLGEFIEEAVNAALPDILGDEAAVGAIDLDGPLELAVAFHDGDVEGIASFPVRSMASARAQLSDGHALEAFGNPALRLVRVRREGVRAEYDFFLAPVAGGAARLLMVPRREGSEDFVNRYGAYLATTAAAQPLPPAEGAAVVELRPQAIERAMRGELDRLVDQMVSEFAPGPDPNNPLFADAARAWVRDALGALRSSLTEARGARLTLGLGDGAASLGFDLAMQRPSAQLAQQALSSITGVSPPMDLYERLPPGAWSYSAWALHTEPLRATLNLGANAVARMVTPRSRLLEADATALRTALGALVSQERVAVASCTSRDPQDRYNSTALLRVSTPSPQFVANVRALVNTLRRPGVARAVRADLHIDPMLWTVAPTTGLPPGSLLLRGTVPTLRELVGSFGQRLAVTPPTTERPAPGARPTPAAPAARPAAPGARPAAAAARPAISELLFVPEGDHVWVVLGGNARTQLAAAQAEHAAPPPIADATEAGTSSVMAVRPGVLTEVFRGDTSLLRMIREAIAQGGPAADAASVGRLRLTERDGATHVSAELTVPSAALGLVGQSVRRGLARP